MATRANWFQPVVGELDDPFALPIEAVGVPIDLAGDRARLIVELVHEVARLDAAGVSCPILQMPDTCCHVCPISEHDGTTAKAELCRAGRSLESALTLLAVSEL